MSWKFAIAVCIIFMSCESNDRPGNTLNTLDLNAAIKSSPLTSDDIILQTFTSTPRVIEGCKGVFFKSEDSAAMQPYVFISNLKGIAFIKLNDRLMEVRLIRQLNTDKITVNELYANEEVEIDLRIKQTQGYGAEVWDYKGLMIIRKKNKREVVEITGKLGC